ncbi:ZIP family zinc transporter [Rhodoglobus vestalii]|uniref:ZIP family zinc transporter n=1 Tax=Rhodoglobus vestalii TaxID=193384 RepID=A0A8H2K240_9MICO|nr:ZIP family zinc transporter [Rhodoglobus vestalii]TQO18675.1 ZIP family zinc transporter [Rhodoglobus vestalii]
MPDFLLAGGAAFASGSMLVVGALVSWFVRVPASVTAGIMAFGAGVLLSTLAYELVQEANDGGGVLATIAGCLAGAILYVIADAVLARYGAQHRKRSTAVQSSEEEKQGSGTAIAIGALFDGIPESLVLGLSVVATGGVSMPLLVAFGLSNLPEGLSATAGMKQSGRSARYVFAVWGGIAIASGIAAMIGTVALTSASGPAVAFVTTIAAGAILAMLSNTMIPEAFARDRTITGLIVTVGFLTAFALHELA